jgi:hypothetical protein
MLCHHIIQDMYPSVSESASVSGTVTSFSQPVRVDEPCVYRKESWDHAIPASPSVCKILTSLHTRDGAYHRESICTWGTKVMSMSKAVSEGEITVSGNYLPKRVKHACCMGASVSVRDEGIGCQQ